MKLVSSGVPEVFFRNSCFKKCNVMPVCVCVCVCVCGS
jgi:hypothetical protein